MFSILGATLQWLDRIAKLHLIKQVIAAANSRANFGENLNSIPEFLKAALDSPSALLGQLRCFVFLPTFLAPVVAPVLMRQHRASKVLVGYLTPVVELPYD